MYTGLLAKEATPSQPTLPRALYSTHTLHVFTMYRTAISRPVNKGIYKYIQICIYRINEREGNRNYPKWGFDQGCLDMVQYLHKNLRLIKEKFQY